MKDAHTFGRRLVEAVIISLACAGALWLIQNPMGASATIERLARYLGQVDPIWVLAMVLVAGILLVLAAAIVVLQATVWAEHYRGVGGGRPLRVGLLVGGAGVFALVAASLWVCADGNVWGLVLAALAVWFGVRVVLKIRAAWVRFWYPAF